MNPYVFLRRELIMVSCDASVSALWIDAQARAIGLHEPPQYIYLAALLMSSPPVYSGKYFSNGTFFQRSMDGIRMPARLH
jgi:hypothetical protein